MRHVYAYSLDWEMRKKFLQPHRLFHDESPFVFSNAHTCIKLKTEAGKFLLVFEEFCSSDLVL